MRRRRYRAIQVALLLCSFAFLLPVRLSADTYSEQLQKGEQLYMAKRYDEAILAFTEASKAPDKETSEMACGYLGLCFHEKGDLDQAIAWHEKALGMEPQFLSVLEDLTGVYFSRRTTYEKGVLVARRAEALFSRNPGVYYNMACYYSLSGKADLSLQYVDKAVYFGFSDMTYMASDADLAAAQGIEPFKSFFIHRDAIVAASDLRDQGTKKKEALAYDEALPLYEQALKQYQDALGPESLAGSTILLALGSVSLAQGRWEIAAGYDEKALTIQSRLLGENHPDVAASEDELGLALYYDGRYDEAIGYYNKALAIQLGALGDDNADVANTYNSLGGVYDLKGEYDQAIDYYQKALSIWTNVLGQEDPRVATCYYNLGGAHRSKGDYDEAIDCLQKALAIQVKALGEEHPDVASSYASLGLIYLNKGEYDQALGYYEKALAIRLKVLGEGHPDVAGSYNGLGAVYFKKGEFGKAIDYYQKALAIRLKVLGDRHPDVAASYQSLGGVYYSEGEYDRAIDYYEKALAIHVKVVGAEHPSVAMDYFGLGGASYTKGDYDKAIAYYEKALAIQLKVFGEKHPDVAISYLALGSAYRSKGEFDRGIGYLEKALAIQQAVLGEEHPDVAHGYDNLGAAYSSNGDYDKAIGYFEKALAIRQKLFGEAHLDVAQSYCSLGSAYYSKNDYDRAIDYDNKALAIQLKLVGNDHYLVAQSYNNLGLAYDSKGEHDRAIAYYERALEIQLKVLGPEHPNVALSYENLGSAYYYKGEYDRAIEYDEKALVLSAHTSDRQLAIQAAKNLGWIYLQLGNDAEAKKAFQEGIGVIEQARGETGAGKTEFTGRNISLYYLSLQASAKGRDMAGVFDAAEAMRARGFLDRLSLSAALSVDGVTADARARMLRLNDEIESLSERRSAEIQKPEAKQDTQMLLGIVNDLEDKERQFAELDQSLMSISRYKELRKPTLAGLKDAQGMLKPDEAILEYVLWDKEQEQQACCLIVKSSGAELVELDKSFAYSKSVMDYRDAIVDGAERRETLGEELYAKLIGACENKLGGIRKLIIIPDGALAFLPFDSLRKDKSSPYLCERYEVSLAPSVSVLRAVSERHYGNRAGQLLALGGARYSMTGITVQRGRRGIVKKNIPTEKTKEYEATQGVQAYYAAQGFQWDDLPGTREEVLAIAQKVYGGKNTQLVLGEQASEQFVKQLSASGKLEQQRVVHFACHGLYDAEYPRYSAVVLSEVSGALKERSPESGYLTVEDVALLKFKADLVNLSACETGLGKEVEGDGVIGLTRSFLVAGANRVAATLWVVDDAATEAFMVELYTLVQKQGMGYAEAMDKVKRDFIRSKEYSDPYFWSGFTMYGM